MTLKNSSTYYFPVPKELGEIIKKYDEVILFGPTDAKAEPYNIFKGRPRF